MKQKTVITKLLQRVTEVYCIMRSGITRFVRYYKVWQIVITYCVRYYKVWQLLQSDMYHRHEKVDKTRLFEFLTKFFILVKVGCFVFGSSNQRCSLEKAVLKNFAIFTGKQLCLNLFLIKLQAFRPPSVLKKHSSTGVFVLILRSF